MLLCTDTLHGQTLQLSLATRGRGVSYRVATFDQAFGKDHLQAMYYGFPGDNEAWIGYGRDFSLSNNNTVSPYAWMVIGKENREKGIGLGGTISGKRQRVDYTATYYNFVPIAGTVKAYSYLDSAEAAYSFNSKLEAGISGAYFRTSGVWDPLVGPMVRWNDRYGSTEFTFRVGPSDHEYRISRTLTRP